MVTLCLLVFLALFVVSIILYVRNDFDEPFLCGATIVTGILTAIFLIWTLSLAITVGTAETIDQKITMYEEENARIEESIDITVKNYMNFEAATYTELKDDDAINLVALFPELKSDSMVQQQIEIYVANNQKIKELKESKIDLSKARWKLYFGK